MTLTTAGLIYLLRSNKQERVIHMGGFPIHKTLCERGRGTTYRTTTKKTCSFISKGEQISHWPKREPAKILVQSSNNNPDFTGKKLRDPTYKNKVAIRIDIEKKLSFIQENDTFIP